MNKTSNNTGSMEVFECQHGGGQEKTYHDRIVSSIINHSQKSRPQIPVDPRIKSILLKDYALDNVAEIDGEVRHD